MVEIDTYQKNTSLHKRERITTVCVLCVWVIVLTLCWVFLTLESLVEDFESAVAYLVMWPFVMVIFIISIYKTGKAMLNLYKHR
jgi:hypothetical protein